MFHTTSLSHFGRSTSSVPPRNGPASKNRLNYLSLRNQLPKPPRYIRKQPVSRPDTQERRFPHCRPPGGQRFRSGRALTQDPFHGIVLHKLYARDSDVRARAVHEGVSLATLLYHHVVGQAIPWWGSGGPLRTGTADGLERPRTLGDPPTQVRRNKI